VNDGKNERKIYKQEKYDKNDGNSTRKFYEKNGKGGKITKCMIFQQK
jgi:hypothetical protein